MKAWKYRKFQNLYFQVAASTSYCLKDLRAPLDRSRSIDSESFLRYFADVKVGQFLKMKSQNFEVLAKFSMKDPPKVSSFSHQANDHQSPSIQLPGV